MPDGFESDGAPLFTTAEARIEAAIFAASRPVLERELQVLLPEGVDVHAALKSIAAFWSKRGVEVVRTPSGWIMRAREDLLPEEQSTTLRRLSDAAGATLMTIAMHQPITVQQIETIRGVRLARGIVESLEGSGLVRSVGRKGGSGRAVMYEVTERFLDWAGLDQLSDLPSTEEAMMLELDSAPNVIEDAA